MTSSERTWSVTSAGGGGPVPASTNTAGRRASQSTSSGQRGAVAVDRTRAARDQPRRAIERRRRGRRARPPARPSRASRPRPGPWGARCRGRPGSSPSRSTSNESVEQDRASVAVTTVVPLPPFAAQQTVTGTGDLPEGPRGAELIPGDVGVGDGTEGVRGSATPGRPVRRNGPQPARTVGQDRQCSLWSGSPRA